MPAGSRPRTMGQDPAFLTAIIVVFIVVAGLVAIAALIINAVVKVKLAKYHSLSAGSRPPTAPPEPEDRIWPPPPAPPP